MSYKYLVFDEKYFVLSIFEMWDLLIIEDLKLGSLSSFLIQLK